MTTQPLPPPPDDDPARPGVPAVICTGCWGPKAPRDPHNECIGLPPVPEITRREAREDQTADRGPR